ncbi:hypothetical protein GQ600_22071 [Phytophthora cactorum]|nr:hypothetical protein GQ600_22071 [Phytophthora cactorum]
MKGKPFVSVAVKASIAFVNVPAVFESVSVAAFVVVEMVAPPSVTVRPPAAPRHDCSSTSTDLQSAGCDGSPTGCVHREYGRGRRPRLGINKRETGGISVRGGHGEHRLIEGAGRVRERQRIGRGPGIGNGGTTAALARDRETGGISVRGGHGEHRLIEGAGRVRERQRIGRGPGIGNGGTTAALARDRGQPGRVHFEG